MQIAIFFLDFLHYHVARCQALDHYCRRQNSRLVIGSIRPQSPELPISGYHTTLANQVNVLVPYGTPSPNSQVAARAIYSFLNENQPDIVAIPGYRTLDCITALLWCKSRGRVPLLMSESRFEDMPRNIVVEFFKGQLVRQYDSAIVGGASHFDYIGKLGIECSRIFTGYDAVDNKFWSEKAEAARVEQNTLRSVHQLPDRYFFATGRFVTKKNFDGLIRAYAQYLRHASSCQPWHLLICGSGPLEEQLNTLVNTANLKDYVHIKPYADAFLLATYYGLAGAFVHASSRGEQWGLVVNEAMASGLPVLVSKTVGSAPELVRDDVNGYTFDPDRTNDLTFLMQHMTNLSSSELEALGNASRRIISQWSTQRFAAQLYDAALVGSEYSRSRPRSATARYAYNVLLAQIIR